MRTPFLAANWKMFKTVDETVAYLREFCALTAGRHGRGNRRRAAVHGAARRG